MWVFIFAAFLGFAAVSAHAVEAADNNTSAQLDEAVAAIRAACPDVGELESAHPYFDLNGICRALSLQCASAKNGKFAAVYDLAPGAHSIAGTWVGLAMENDPDRLAKAALAIHDAFGVDVIEPAWIVWLGASTNVWAIYEPQDSKQKYACNLFDFTTLDYEKFASQAASLAKATAAPSAPTNVRASNEYPDYVGVTWTAVAGASSYEIFRGTTSNPNYSVQIGTGIDTVFIDTTCTPGKIYFYWVKAGDTTGISQFSNGSSGYRRLPPPTEVNASDTYPDKVLLTWNPVSGATLYKIYRNTWPDPNSAALIGTDSGSPFEDKTGVRGKPYYYWIRATNTMTIGSDYSEPYAFGERWVPPITDLAASDGLYTDKVVLNWTPVPGARFYMILRGEINSTNGVQIGTDTAPPYENKTCTPGHKYRYWVVAVRDFQNTTSNSDTGYRGLSAPTGAQASDGIDYGKIVVSWTGSWGATDYNIYRSTANSSAGAVFVGTANCSPYEDTGAQQGKTYYYWVKALNANCARTSGLSNSCSGYLKKDPGFIASWRVDGKIRINTDGYSDSQAIDSVSVHVFADQTFEDDYGFTGQWSVSGSIITLRYDSEYFENIADEWFGFDANVSTSSSNYLKFTGKLDGDRLVDGTISGYVIARISGETYGIKLSGYWDAEKQD